MSQPPPAFNFAPGRRNFIRAYRQMFGSAPSKESIEAYMAADKRSRPSAARSAQRSKRSAPEVSTITKRYEWDMAHRIPNHQGKCARLHGHRYTAEIDITGPLVSIPGASDEGMVIDFYALKQVLDVNFADWDHRCMLHKDDPMMASVQWPQEERGEQRDSIMGVFRVPYIPTAENIARDMLTQINKGLPARVRCTRVRVYETPNGWAEVRA